MIDEFFDMFFKFLNGVILPFACVFIMAMVFLDFCENVSKEPSSDERFVFENVEKKANYDVYLIADSETGSEFLYFDISFEDNLIIELSGDSVSDDIIEDIEKEVLSKE